MYGVLRVVSYANLFLLGYTMGIIDGEKSLLYGWVPWSPVKIAFLLVVGGTMVLFLEMERRGRFAKPLNPQEEPPDAC